ncbi:hypothetical protein [Alteromonas sp. CYL-A6]|uniref:hypothetical protein n=1 Tax=Alteromonas nitratireducens TaxID=3390813 RepID=UPI0034AAC9A0
METSLPLYKKLIVLYRIEPGCLGPEGINYAEDFCTFAKQQIKNTHSHFIRWIIKPRYDKSLPELEFQIKGSAISRPQAAKFMSAFSVDIDNFETQLDETLAELVEAFFDR